MDVGRLNDLCLEWSADTAAHKNEIAALAHRLWLDRGCPEEGGAEEDWLFVELRRPSAAIVRPGGRSSPSRCDEGPVRCLKSGAPPEKVLQTHPRPWRQAA